MNDLQRIILAKLSSKSATGYTICQELTPLTNHSHQQIYRELNKMADNGHATFVVKPQEGKPDRKIYTITKSGEAQHVLNNEKPITVETFNRGHLMVAIMSSTNELELLNRLKAYAKDMRALSKDIVCGDSMEKHVQKSMINAQISVVDTLINSLTKNYK